MLNQRLGDILAYKVKHDLRQKIVTSKSKASIGVQTNILTEVIDGITPFLIITCHKCLNLCAYLSSLLL